MGYDTNRFIKEVDDEFICPLCNSVLQNGIQISKCEHLFCEECIREWFKNRTTCPVDNGLLSSDDLKPISRPLRNILNKHLIKCNFESNGCIAVIQLEDLQNHISTCPFDPNIEVICNKGCGLKITKAEYENENCYSHLAKELAQFNAMLELRLSRGPAQLWQKCNGIKFDYNEANIIEYSNERHKVSLVQSVRPLTRERSYFEIKILELGDRKEIAIGLTNDRYPIDKLPGWNFESIGYHGDNGNMYISKGCGTDFGPVWQKGDVIGCGIKFPLNVTDKVVVFFNRNSVCVGEQLIHMPSNGFYPTIGMRSIAAKIKFIFRS